MVTYDAPDLGFKAVRVQILASLCKKNGLAFCKALPSASLVEWKLFPRLLKLRLRTFQIGSQVSALVEDFGKEAK